MTDEIEKKEAADFVATVLAVFMEHTRKIMASPVDYETARQWEDAGVPVSIAVRGIETKAARAEGKPWLTNGRAKLEYFTDDVMQVFQDWKRAVGPC